MQDINCNKLSLKSGVSSTEPGKVKYYVGIAVYIILLYFFNNIKYVNISFLTINGYINCLWAINLALTTGIIGNFVLLLYRPRWFPHLVQGILRASAILAAFIVYKIFPFTFAEQNLERVVKIVLILIMIGLAIFMVVELVRFFYALLFVKKIIPPGNDSPNPD